MFAKIGLQLHSTVHVSGVEKYLPLRSSDFFRFADSFRFAALGPLMEKVPLMLNTT